MNWLYFTGLSAGSVAFVAVQKITNAKWSGMIIRFAEASVAFLPVSLIGLRADFHCGLSERSTARCRAPLHELQHAKAVWLSHGFMFARLATGPARAHRVRLEAGLGGHDTRHAMPCSAPRRRSGAFALRAMDPGLRWRRTATVAAHEPASTGWRRPVRVTLRMVLTLVAFDGIMALQPHWFSNLLGGFYLHGLVPGRAHARWR